MRLADRLRTALAAPFDGRALRHSDFDEDELHEPTTDAAVLIAITDRPEPGVILTKRHAALRRHAGQVALPGGRIDPDDDGAVAAALREAWEEVGLDPAAVEVVGAIERYRTGTNYLITPVVAVIPPDLPLVAQESEVDAIFEVPLAFLSDPANRVETTGLWRERERRLWRIDWQDRHIWGATAAMLVNLSHRIAPLRAGG